MAAAQAIPLAQVDPNDQAARLKRRQAVDSVLGTMGAEGELPSEITLALMEDYVGGRLPLNTLVDTIFANARR